MTLSNLTDIEKIEALLEKVAKLEHHIEVHHSFYKCIPKSVASAREEILQREIDLLECDKSDLQGKLSATRKVLKAQESEARNFEVRAKSATLDCFTYKELLKDLVEEIEVCDLALKTSDAYVDAKYLLGEQV